MFGQPDSSRIDTATLRYICSGICSECPEVLGNGGSKKEEGSDDAEKLHISSRALASNEGHVVVSSDDRETEMDTF